MRYVEFSYTIFFITTNQRSDINLHDKSRTNELGLINLVIREQI